MTTGKKYEVLDKSGYVVHYGWHYAPISYKALEKELRNKYPDADKVLIEKL